MPPRSQRLVRRKPLSERLQTMFNPMDFYLWLSEEIQTFDWDSNAFGIRFGLVANFLFLVARANSGSSEAADDVFGDGQASSWVSFLVRFSPFTRPSIGGLNKSLMSKLGPKPRLGSDPGLGRERILHHDTIPPLPTLRSQRREGRAFYTERPSCSGRFLTGVLVADALLAGHDRVRVRRGAGASRQDS